MDSQPSNLLLFRKKEIEKPLERPIERHMWSCQCGCLTFRLFYDGTSQCAQCGVWQEGVRLQFDP